MRMTGSMCIRQGIVPRLSDGTIAPLFASPVVVLSCSNLSTPGHVGKCTNVANARREMPSARIAGSHLLKAWQ